MTSWWGSDYFSSEYITLWSWSVCMYSIACSCIFWCHERPLEHPHHIAYTTQLNISPRHNDLYTFTDVIKGGAINPHAHWTVYLGITKSRVDLLFKVNRETPAANTLSRNETHSVKNTIIQSLLGRVKCLHLITRLWMEIKWFVDTHDKRCSLILTKRCLKVTMIATLHTPW